MVERRGSSERRSCPVPIAVRHKDGRWCASDGATMLHGLRHLDGCPLLVVIHRRRRRLAWFVGPTPCEAVFLRGAAGGLGESASWRGLGKTVRDGPLARVR